jgi:hypothetical protein
VPPLATTIPQMGFLDRFKQKSAPAPRVATDAAVPADPAQWTTLWDQVEALPDPWDENAPARVEQCLAALTPDEAGRLWLEFRSAYDRLDAAAVAAHVQPHPWRGPGEPFSPRRFGVVRERVVLSGRVSFETILADPSRVSTFDTGPDLTLRQRVLHHTPPPLHALLTGTSADVIGAYPAPACDPERWPALPKGHAWERLDPENIPVHVYPEVDDAVLGRLRDLPCGLTEEQLRVAEDEGLRTEHVTAEQVRAWRATGEIPAGYDEDDFVAISAPVVVATAYAACDAGLRIWEAIGRPHAVDRPEGWHLGLVIDQGWSRGRRGYDTLDVGRLRACIDARAVAQLSLEDLTDALTAMAADVLADDIGAAHECHDALVSLRDEYAGTLPGEARAALRTKV